ncbi:uncharacterized protein [Euwallacea similis]|uniref:uncharacterized protein n=1 Tax=Euwallacea similis TaxID=1736056 RepID=UPI00344FEE8C
MPCFAKFRSGDFDIDDASRSGRPTEINSSDVKAIVESDPSQSVREIATKLNISHTSVEKHLHQLGYVSRLNVWVPHQLTEANLITRISICDSLRKRQESDPFLKQIVTGDEKWIIYENVKRKRSWGHSSQPPQTTSKVGLHPKKIMLSVWWDFKGTELLPSGKTIDSTLYCSQLTKLKEAIRTKQPELFGWDVLAHPPYSPDLAPSDFHLFRSLQNSMKGKTFKDEDAVKNHLDRFFADKPQSFYERSIMKLVERWQEVINKDELSLSAKLCYSAETEEASSARSCRYYSTHVDYGVRIDSFKDNWLPRFRTQRINPLEHKLSHPIMPRSRTIQPEANIIEPSVDQEARIFIKAPPFSRTDPELWFSQLESQFFINGVTSDDLKFHTTIGIMDTESLICVRDLIIKPPMNNKFQTLRQKVLDALVESQEKKYKKLFSQLQLGDKKPSILLSEMNSLGGSSLQEEMLKTLWMQRLPHNMQTILTACSLPLSEVANIADKIADVEFSQVSQIKSEVCTSSPNEINKNTSSEEFKHITKHLLNFDAIHPAEIVKILHGAGTIKITKKKLASVCLLVTTRRKTNDRVVVGSRRRGYKGLPITDTGSDVSLLPKSFQIQQNQSQYTLFAANNTCISTFGTKTLTVSLGLRRTFTWNFIVAQTNHAIIGIDFLHYFNIILDLGSKRIIDSTTNLTNNEITKFSSTPSSLKHSISHTILTEGFPISSKPRRFSAEKLKLAKQEIQHLINLAIITPFGLFEFTRMQFGLKNAAQSFQRFINEVLGDLDFCFSYIDDILIASTNEAQHKEHLKTIFERLHQYGLTINLNKCVFGEHQVQFLGYQVSEKDLRRFLGMLNFYRKCLPHAAHHQSVLHDLHKNCKKNDKTPIKWTDETVNAFNECKHDLANAATLNHPSSSAPLSLTVDASDFAMGAVVEQMVNSSWKPLSFFSKKFSKTQCNYSTYDRELLALYSAIKYFRHFLEGRPFTIYTDHKPLIYAFIQKSDKASPKQMRHLDFISQFSTNILHISGKNNIVADTLSRIQTISFPNSIDYDEIAKAQTTDPEFQHIFRNPQLTSLTLKQFQVPNTQNLIYCDDSNSRIRPFIPKHFRQAIFNKFHNLSHPGIKGTTKLISSRFVWPSMNKNIREWTRCCINCQKAKIHKHTVTPFKQIQIPDSRFHDIHIDIIGPLPPSNGFTYCLTIIDRFSCWAEAYPMTNISSETVANCFYSNWICRFGTPIKIFTDQGRQFESSLFQSLTQILGCKRARSSPYHPNTNGKVERWHRTLKAAIKAYATERWTEILPTILLGLRSTLREEIGVSPAEMLYGTTLRLPGEFFQDSNIVDHPSSFIQTLKQKMQSLQPVPTTHHSNRKIFITPELNTCTHVFLRNDTIKRSLQPPYEGPFLVKKREDKYFTIVVRDKEVNISMDRLKPAFLISQDPKINNQIDSLINQPIIHHHTKKKDKTVRFANV